MYLTRDKEDRYHNNEHRNAHEAKREAPAEADVAVSNSKVDPICKEDAQEVGYKDQRESRATVMGF